MACEALAAEVELWERVSKRHQSSLGLSPGSGGVGQLGSPIPPPKGDKESLCKETRARRLSQVTPRSLVVHCGRRGALGSCFWDTFINLSLDCCHTRGPSGVWGRVDSHRICPWSCQQRKCCKAAVMHPLRSRDKGNTQTHHHSLLLTPLQQNICSPGIKSLSCSKQISSPWNSYRSCCICSHHGQASAPGGWGLGSIRLSCLLYLTVSCE